MIPTEFDEPLTEWFENSPSRDRWTTYPIHWDKGKSKWTKKHSEDMDLLNEELLLGSITTR